MVLSHLSLDEILARHDWILTFTHPPSVASLLRTNDAPSPLQSTQLKASLDDLKRPLAEAQSDLDLLRSAVATLETRVSRLQSIKLDYKTALSPIRHVPMEVIAEILRHSWPTGTLGITGSVFGASNPRHGPWILGHVCNLWRGVIEEFCPELWATLVIENTHPANSGSVNKELERLRRVLERSRNHPLDFIFRDVIAHAHPAEDHLMEQCFGTMVALSKRWRVVELSVPLLQIPRLSLIHGRIDWLREVYLSYCDDPPSEDVRAFEIAPKLEILYLSRMHPDAKIHFPTANLICFSDERKFLGDRLFPKYIDIVKSASKLRSFSYINLPPPFRAEDQVPLYPGRVTSSTLEELYTSSLNFMRSIKLPALKAFSYHVTLGRDTGVGVYQVLHEMIIHSQCSLTRLSLRTAWLDGGLLEVLRVTPQLEELDIRYEEWVERFNPVMISLIAEMTKLSSVEGYHQHRLIPSLQRLKIFLSGVSSITVSFLDWDFVEMIAARMPEEDTPGLRELSITVIGEKWVCDLDDEEYPFEMLEEEGLDVELDLCHMDGS
ncbi:hypothetical protein IW261DRAFT_442110 [Armillaria novae-zelandiae]|uniref:F-box domain-containing protein n=1 Tax=Armillaria novae-zelandiae TaxID=153914 RepID=A0AA39P2V7_9AGAR|nr:hypothetical protein IW261DRAFT_442110 [Armillaria novae-zelandiae]